MQALKNMSKPAALLVAGLLAGGVIVAAFAQRSEVIEVKYRGPVDLKYFECNDISRSSFIRRVCYDHSNEYMLISLNGTFYHYCEIDSGTVSALLDADSMGRYFDERIKRRFDCRTHRVPAY
jgi:KTSC domain-containing protein